MFDWERFECDPTNLCARPLVDDVAIFDRVMLQFLPRLLRRIHRTRRPAFQSPRVIGMRVREHDRARTQPLKFSKPIKAAIDHHIGAAAGDHQRRVHVMPSRPLLNLTARAEKYQVHLEKGGAILPMALSC